MRLSAKIVSAFLIWLIAVVPSSGFSTGSHFDLTRAVLAEHDFRDTPIRIVQVETWLTDYYTNSPTYGDEHRKILEKLHFDNLYDGEQVKTYWQVLLRNLKIATETAARDNDQMAMLVTLALGTHAVQDFYSHSNWAELHPRGTDGEFRSDTYLAALSKQDAALKNLYTGKFPDDRLTGPIENEPVPAKAAIHGGYREGLNKDSPTRPLWDEAYVFAYAGSLEIVGLMKTWAETVRPGFWDSVREYAVTGEEEKKLDKDIVAARNISMWVKAKGQDGTWKGDQSGSTRFFSAFSSKWVTSDASAFVKALREGKIQDGLAADLYTRIKALPELPDVKPFSLVRNAVLIRITYVGESKKSSLVSHIFTASGSDFYSRIFAGGQEFWGRTIQQTRQTAEPWYEIYFADPKKTPEVPVTIALWDEDNIESEKDERVDINPAEGVFELKTVLRLSDNTLTGDLNGIFNSPDKIFSSAGENPKKRSAVIRGFITRRPIR
jgi:hypothetical protein